MTVRAWQTGALGRIELDRPRALNALDLEMIRGIRSALEGWRDDAAVAEVLVTSSSDRAFCAGGDVRAAREAVLAGRPEAADGYFAEEYALNLAIAEYPKPYVAVVDGAALGGGMGVSVHASARVVTGRAVMAMPEAAIGFSPDVGASHFLTRLDGDPTTALGRYLALTGTRAAAADLLATGLGTHLVHEESVADLVRLAEEEGTLAALTRYAVDPAEAGTGVLAARREEITELFAAGPAEEILDRLAAGAGEFAAATLGTLEQMSPTSMVAAVELLAAGRESDLPGCLANELAVAGWVVRQPDFAEGVRAVLVDKDRNPTWDPGAVGGVDVDALRAVLGR